MKENSFNFLGYRISKIDCEINNNFDPNDLKINNTISVQKNYVEEIPNLVEVVMDVKLETDNGAFYFFIKMQGGFQGSEDISKETLEKFSSINAPAIMYPFIRSIISSYTVQAGIPPVILPTVNFVAKYNEEKNNSCVEEEK